MIPLVMLISVLSLAFAVYLAREVLAADEGTPQMQEIAGAIKEGAEAFLRRQNGTILVIGLGVAAIIFLLYTFVRPVTSQCVNDGLRIVGKELNMFRKARTDFSDSKQIIVGRFDIDFSLAPACRSNYFVSHVRVATSKRALSLT